MITIKQDVIERLENGDFSEVRLDFWFRNHDFDYILAIVKGCAKNLDLTMLSFVSMYAQYLLVEPNAKDWDYEGLMDVIRSSGTVPVMVDSMTYEELILYWNKWIIEMCEHILSEVIHVGSKHISYCGTMLAPLQTCENDNVRLHCCANLDWSIFLNDSSPRVVKVANIRKEFDQKWSGLASNLDLSASYEKQRIEFLTSALEKNAIQCGSGDIRYPEEDKMLAIFRSLLFEGEVKIDGFDADIFYTIQDKRILATTLNELIKEGKIVFRNGMMPDFFAETKRGAVLKREVPGKTTKE